MYDHIGLKVKDVAASARFYKAALAPLGHELASENKDGAGLGPKGAPALWLHRDAAARSGVHVAFAAAGLRKDYGPNYYAAFLIDPDGNNVEAVCLK